MVQSESSTIVALRVAAQMRAGSCMRCVAGWRLPALPCRCGSAGPYSPPCSLSPSSRRFIAGARPGHPHKDVPMSGAQATRWQSQALQGRYACTAARAFRFSSADANAKAAKVPIVICSLVACRIGSGGSSARRVSGRMLRPGGLWTAKAQFRRSMWARWGSNPRPIDYESTPLSAVLTSENGLSCPFRGSSDTRVS
jgi:hypothetical protein